MYLRLWQRRPALQKIKIAAEIRLLHMRGEHRAIAARQARRRFDEGPRPRLHLGVTHVEILLIDHRAEDKTMT